MIIANPIKPERLCCTTLVSVIGNFCSKHTVKTVGASSFLHFLPQLSSMSSGEVEHIYISLWQICLERYLLRFSQHMHDFCRSTTENVWCLFLHSQVEYLFVVLAVSITNVEHTSIAVLLPTF